MPRWLTEDTASVYPALGAVALVVLVIGWMFRDRAIPVGFSKDRRKAPPAVPVFPFALVLFLLIALLAGGVRLIDYLVVTDHEQIEEAVRAMADGINARETERVFRHVSEKFQSPQKRDKAKFKELARRPIEGGEIVDVVVWDFLFEKEASRAERTGTVLFLVKAKGSVMGTPQDLFYRCEAVFHLDPDNQWRLQTFWLRDPVVNQEVPISY
jgi:hypothetical protein